LFQSWLKATKQQCFKTVLLKLNKIVIVSVVRNFFQLFASVFGRYMSLLLMATAARKKDQKFWKRICLAADRNKHLSNVDFIVIIISGIFPLLVKLCLCLSLFFTYPVMMFPVVQIIEKRFKPQFSSVAAGVSNLTFFAWIWPRKKGAHILHLVTYFVLSDVCAWIA